MNTYKYSAPAQPYQALPDADTIMDELAEHALEENSLEQAMLKLSKKGVKEKYGDSVDGLDRLAADSHSLRRRLQSEYTFEPLIQQLRKQIQALVREELRALNERSHCAEQDHNSKMEDFLHQSADLAAKLEEMRSGERRPSDQAIARMENSYEDLYLKKHQIENEWQEMRRQEAQRLASLQRVPHSPGQALQKLKKYEAADAAVGQALAQLTALADEIAAIERAQAQPGFSGHKGVGLKEAVKIVERVLRIERLENRLRKGLLSPADEELLAEMLGGGAMSNVNFLKQVQDKLLQAGYLEFSSDEIKLSPRAVRRIGRKALSDVFSNLRTGTLGAHEVARKGAGQPNTNETKTYGFGDAFNIHLGKTLMNALKRDASRIPISIRPGDFEVFDESRTVECSNVLMLDLSYTMAQNNKLQAAKKVVFALDSLIRSRYPNDTLHIVGFATYARELSTQDLPCVGLSLGHPFTNIQDGLQLAEKLISREHAKNRQIILITDGEPTAFCRDGDLFVDYPPTPEIFAETMREVVRLTRKGITINIFMLDEKPALVSFVEQMMRVNKGRAFLSSPQRLGEYLLLDFVSRRKRLIT
ncbi:MAG: hypothetical protein C4520_01230 [Candidatus Abyssobacteria bacterium SURF_5]|uniref:VWFA domain-containing protein n=1 Tax=Abyssobacteria bacterium (strain SURF_5) TaxID=2093360 RepID=A0A3A4P008_ABYX5|nr:MAG: hypothetical protein C4520_01230 [Candidatus Abyssubacteria bacterium SURF_5]